jgi:pilus assembly protein Flp/PilA
MRNLLKYILNTKGMTAVDYGLILSMVAVALVAALTLLGGGLNNVFITMTTDM